MSEESIRSAFPDGSFHGPSLDLHFNMTLSFALAIAASFAQAAITLFAGPAIGFILIMVYFLLSSYFDTAALFGDCSMLLRSSVADPSSVSGEAMLAALVSVSLVFVFLGCAIVYKSSFLMKKRM